MPSPNATPTPITPPRVPLIDPRTGLIDRAWYLFFLSLQDIAASVVDDVVGPSADALLASYDAALLSVNQELQTQPSASAVESQVAEMQKQIEALNALPPPTLGTVTAVTATTPVVSSGGIAPDISLAAGYGDTQNPYAVKTANYVLAGPTTGAAAVPTFRALVAADIPTLPYGAGTVTSVSVVSANGFAGTVATATTTPAITLTTTITGLLKGNGTAISAAVANTDYMGVGAPVTKTADFTVADGEIWYINNKSGSTCTVTLPAASSWTGRTLTFKNMQAQTLVSASSNVVPIDSTTAGTAILLAVVGNWATMVSDGTNWIIMQQAANNCLLLE
jgi:hypothetical protein